MPYFITDKAQDCAGWATIKEDGEVIGCHTTKQGAIDQMVAVSLAEDIEVGGERKKHKKMKPKSMSNAYRELPDNYRPALAEDVPEGRACGNCFFYDESRQNADGTKAWCEKWDEFVDGAYYCNAWQEHDESDDDEMDDESDLLQVQVRVLHPCNLTRHVVAMRCSNNRHQQIHPTFRTMLCHLLH